jgi:hypothetical protein
MIRLIIFTFCFFLYTSLFSQTTLLRKDLNEQTQRTQNNTKGPGLKFYNTIFIRFGINHTIPKVEFFKSDISSIVHQSGFIGFGIYNQRKINQYLSLGLNYGYLYKNISVCKMQKLNVWDSNNQQYNKEKYNFHQIILEPNIRFHLNKQRGDYTGKFIDIGASAHWSLLNSQRLSVVNNWNIRSETWINRYPEFVTRWETHAFLRYGFNEYSIFINYRLNNLINANTPSEYADLPKFSTGLNFNF